ncbi:MAG: S8 family serine peptidase [Gemmatimonadetes bacterium]|nr:S8 family serine peptidase [Gemmatimonadota bacterium]
MKRVFALLLPFAFVACQDTSQPISPPDAEPTSTALAHSRGAEVIPDRYIVVFNDRVADAPGLARRLAQAHGGSLHFTYDHAIKGFAATLPAPAVSALRNNPNVAYIEQDQVVTTMDTQRNATWGLDRTDQRALPLNTEYNYNQTGSGVNAYIIDTGILLTHQEFTDRLIGGFDAITSGGTANDCNGHGTHVAGTVGGTVYGVAKAVKLSPIRVLDCNGSGTTSGVIAGVDWVTANRVKPAVANMSLGGGASASLDEAVRKSVAAGVTYAVAAGNGDRLGRQQDACNYSPARVREALTVGATTNTDAKTSWSNFGECVDIFAPGASITSAWHTSSTAINTISGTSMASPHVAGVAALYLQVNTGASASQVFAAIRDGSTKGIVTNSSTAKNDLLYSLFIGGGGGGGDPAPTAPAAPSHLTASAASTSQINLSWTDNSTDEDGFEIERCQDSGCSSWSQIATVGANTTTYANSTGLSSGTSYSYRVRAFNSAGKSGYSNTASATTSSAPADPIALSGTGSKVQGRWRADLSWTPAGTSTNIDVFRNGSKIATATNNGSFVDQTNFRGGGSLTYKVCEAGTSTCSNEITINF